VNQRSKSSFWGFDLKLWRKLKFRFRDEYRNDGSLAKIATGKYGKHTLNLRITEILAIASVDNDETGDTERHAVFEEEAVEWFCRVSPEFAHVYKNLSPAPL